MSWNKARAVRGVGLLALMLLADCDCHGRSPASPAGQLTCEGCNLVIVSLTNVRKAHVGMYGYPRATTPNLDRFFADSFVFENAFAPASWTLPVLSSLITSKYPYFHGLMSRYNQDELGDDELTLAEVLRAQGYRTAAFTGGGDYNRRFGVSQGFDYYLDERNYHGYGIRARHERPRAGNLAYVSVGPLIPVAEQWLEEHHDQPFFVVLQGYDAHCPFTPKPPFDSRFDPDYRGDIDYSRCLWTFGPVDPIERDGVILWPVLLSGRKPGEDGVLLSSRDIEHMKALYDGEIAQADADLASFFATLDRLDLTEKTIVIFLAEHGDLFGEHGRFMRGGPHRGTFYDPVLNFPLAIKHPRASQGARITAEVETIDILPTLLELLAINDPMATQRQGQSLTPILRDPRLAPERTVFAGSRYTVCNDRFAKGFSTAEAVRRDGWKLIVEKIYEINTRKLISEIRELYRVAEDPLEQNDVFAQNPAVANELEQLLNAKFAAAPARDADFHCKDQPGWRGEAMR